MKPGCALQVRQMHAAASVHAAASAARLHSPEFLRTGSSEIVFQ